MENSTQRIMQRLYKKTVDEFEPLATRLALEGRTVREITAAFQSELKIRTDEFYKSQKKPQRIGDIFCSIVGSLIKEDADSKAEQIFFDMLSNESIKFEFQHTIGPYRVDYLFSGFLVVELDGPLHDKEYDVARDLYLEKMGYKIMRIPLWILIWDPGAVIDELRDAIKKGWR